MINPAHFLVNTDKPMDKIVYIKETSVATGAGIDVTIPHGLSFIPLPMMQWSTSADFSVAYEPDTGPFPSANPGYAFESVLTVEANATNLVVRYNGIIPNLPAYVRIFAFAPHDFTGDTPATASQGDSFVLNSGYNYMKLITANKVSVASGATSTISQTTGITPHVLAWTEFSGTILPVNLSYPLNNVTIEPTTASIIIRNESFLDYTVHYRMYYNA